MTGWPFGDLRPLGYGVVLADPPWSFENYSKAGERKNPKAHYACMKTPAIQALPVGHLARGDCLLFMWATFPMLRDALATVDAWGFRYVTGGAWHKKTRGGKTAFGTGYVFRSACEPFLVGVVGSIRYGSRSERNLIEAVAREHSRKPDEQYPMLERLVPDAARCELFARTRRPGWASWGDQADKFSAIEGDPTP